MQRGVTDPGAPARPAPARRLVALRRSLRSRLRCEQGFTLIELLVGMVLSLILVTAVMAFMITSLDQGNAVSSRAEVTSRATASLEQLVSQLREAVGTVVVSDPSSTTTAISFSIPTPNNDTTSESASWTCPSSGATAIGTCTEVIGGASRQEIPDVDSATFSAISSTGSAVTISTSSSATNPAYIGAQLQVQDTSQADASQTHAVAGASQPITVQTGVDLRNLG